MSAAQVTASATQSRDSMVDFCQTVTSLNIEDCIHFLHQYNWKLQDLLDDFYKGKEFKNIPNKNSNEKIEKNRSSSTSTQKPNKSNTNNDQNQQVVEEDDLYYAQLLHYYGDADESARRCYSEEQHNQRPQQFQPPQQFRQQSKENIKNGPIYHEKQKYLRCGVHALNNLFQRENLFTHEYLDGIVHQFDKRYENNDYGTSWIGDYDLRILIEAIKRQGHAVQQINFYSSEPLQNLPWDSYFGLLINLNGAHWLTIKCLNGIYYNLDSTLKKPWSIGPKDYLVNYLIFLIQRFKSVYLFAVL
ncbi:unnamed protein product [Rotaria sp. Silwood1]|nr:unnamed protein product [Rotaria sp. Silwood1]CAF1506410.1 unnamed protein product [Rotaria sp. Silwood1]CAF3716733.1 unnamed protein product [Rotaria sp. Silwood1]CAF4685271.1 unnamed protein product [Rotaria sp. Silwood1]